MTLNVNRWHNDGRPSWGALVAREPRLSPLLTEALVYHQTAGDDFCANGVFFGYRQEHQPSLKGRLSELVGWGRRPKDDLGTTDAYDVAYETIYDALPDCRHDGMCF